MSSTTFRELEWIHDAELLEVLYDASSSAGRSLRLTMRCPADSGYPPWEGKTIHLFTTNLAVLKHVVYEVEGSETIDAVRPGVSKALLETTMSARRMGIRFPSLEASISFHSGSRMEIICEDLQVEVEP